MAKKLNIKRVITASALAGSLVGGLFVWAVDKAPEVEWVEVEVQAGDTPLSIVEGDKHILPEFLEVNGIEKYMGEYMIHPGDIVLVPAE